MGEPRVDRVGLRHDRGQVVGDQYLERAAEEAPRGLAARDHRGQGLGVAQPHEHVPAEHRGEDQRVHPPPTSGLEVEQQTHLGEVELALHPGLNVSDPHRRPASGAEPASLHGEPVQRPIRHPHPLPGQQLLDLHDRQRVVLDPAVFDAGHPGPDLLLIREQGLPRGTVPGGPDRADRLEDQPDQLVGDRLVHRHTGLARQPLRLGRLDIAPSGLAVHPRPLRDLPQPSSLEPGPQHLTHLDHTDLPESHPS